MAAVDGAISRPSPSPDGTRVAFIASLNGRPVRSYSQPDLFVVDRATGTVTNLTERYDYDIGGGLAGDQRAPRGSSATRPIWTADGTAIVTVAAAEGRVNLVRIDAATGAVSAITEGDHEVQGFTATRDGQAALLSVGADAHRRAASRTPRSARRRSRSIATPNDGADGVARPCRARDVLDAIV